MKEKEEREGKTERRRQILFPTTTKNSFGTPTAKASIMHIFIWMKSKP
jgi:hypothetical protein